MRHKLIAMVMAALIGLYRKADAINHTAAEQMLKTVESFDQWTGDLTRTRAEAMADSRGQLGLGTVLAAFVLVIAAMVVLIVVDRFDQSLGSPSSSNLSTAETDILSGFGDMASLIGPLLLIAIGVVIIGLIRRVQGQ